MSKGLQTIVKAAVETVYPELMLIHQKKFTVHLSKFHTSNLLAKIPIEVDVNLKIS